jgi:curved DNA-binding protein CbpA
VPESEHRTYYETLQVHPAAPFDLVTAAYWRLNHELAGDESGNGAVQRRHELTQAYGVLADPARRDAYDLELGLPPRESAPEARRGKPLVRKLLPGGLQAEPDYYEIIRVQPDAMPGIIEDAYETMRTHYLRLVGTGHAPIELLDVLEEAYSVTSDAERRKEYDARRNGHANGGTQQGASAIVEDRSVESVQEPPVRAAAVTNELTVVTAASAEEAPPEEEETPPVKSTVDWRIRERAASAGRGLRNVGRALLWLGRAAVIMLVLIPRILYGIGQFFVAVVIAIITAPETPPQPAVRRASPEREWPEREWPEEEETVVSRLAASASRGGDAVQQRTGRAKASVVVLDGPEKGARFEVGRWPVNIGAGEQCDIVLPDLAPEQLRLMSRDGRTVLYTLAEIPPVLVNGEPVAWSEVTEEDAVHVGPHTIRIEGVGSGSAQSR